MEINKDNFAEAIKKEEFKDVLLPLITETDAIKTIINNKSDILFKEKIDDEVREMYNKEDSEMFDILGERPSTKEGGGKQKTYEKRKELFKELSELRKTKDSLTKDAKVIELTNQIEKLKKEGGAKHVQDVFDQAKSDWEKRELEYKTKIEDATKNNLSFRKKTEIQQAVQQIKFDPNTPESIQKIVISQAEKELIERSKFEDDKFIVLKEDGKPSLNSKFEPKSAFEALMSMDAIKDIALKADKSDGGGGADPTIEGSIETKSVDGKDTKKLILQEGSFKTKLEFQKVSNQALIDAGISKSDEDYVKLKDQAYADYKVADLPTQ